MTEVSFYHLLSSPLEKAMPKLLEKIVAANQRAVVMAPNDELVEKYNELLWTYSSRIFLPHGSKNDGYSDQQPIYLTAGNENPNNASLLVLTNGIETEISNYEKCFDIFDGSDEQQLSKARARYQTYKKQGYAITYWKQTVSGGWESGLN
jgi:DNA polymerase-3 subunit chi